MRKGCTGTSMQIHRIPKPKRKSWEPQVHRRPEDKASMAEYDNKYNPEVAKIRVASCEPGGKHGFLFKFDCPCVASANHEETWQVSLCGEHGLMVGAILRIKRLIFSHLKSVPVPQAAVAPKERFELSG